jgi:DNA-binding response OmpR family regulator
MDKNKQTILVVDDDEEVVDYVKLALEKEGYNIAVAYNGTDALRKCENEKVDLAILDLGIPGLSGDQVQECIKKKGVNIGIIIITGSKDPQLAVKCMRLGPHNYFFKPFSSGELAESVNAYFYHTNYKNEQKKILEIKDFCMNLTNYEVTIEGNKMDFSPKEFDLLYIFMKKPEKLISREEICEKLYGDSTYAKHGRAFNMLYKRFKKKLPHHIAAKIKSIRGRGLKFCP